MAKVHRHVIKMALDRTHETYAELKCFTLDRKSIKHLDPVHRSILIDLDNVAQFMKDMECEEAEDEHDEEDGGKRVMTVEEEEE